MMIRYRYDISNGHDMNTWYNCGDIESVEIYDICENKLIYES